MITKGYASTPQGQIHFRSSGHLTADTIPIVMLHQTASSSVMWEKVMSLLDDGMSVIAFDTPGFGNSYDPEGYMTIKELSDVIVRASDDLGVQHFHLLGHHTGVCLAAEIAVAQLQRNVRSSETIFLLLSRPINLEITSALPGNISVILQELRRCP